MLLAERLSVQFPGIMSYINLTHRGDVEYSCDCRTREQTDEGTVFMEFMETGGPKLSAL